MYINPFVAGVLTTIGVELAGLFILAVLKGGSSNGDQ